MTPDPEGPPYRRHARQALVVATKPGGPVIKQHATLRQSARELSYPDLELRVEPEAGDLLVSQAGRSYLARGWQLTCEVRAVIELALGAGLRHMIQDGHPRESNLRPNGSGADYLTFSDAPERGWVFVLDMDSCPRRENPRQVKFNKRFKPILRAAGIPCPPEWRSPQELVVRLEDLPQALEVTRPWWARLGSRKDVAAERGKHATFVDEEDLHSHIVQGWAAFPLAPQLELIQSRYILGTTARREGEIDILARDRVGNIWIIELKNRAVSNAGTETPHQQLVRYMTHPGIRSLPREAGDVRGVLIAQEMDYGQRTEVRDSHHPVIAYEATKAGPKVRLQEVSRSAACYGI